MPILGQIRSFLGKKKLILTGESKSFGTHITKKTPKLLVRIVFWSSKAQYGPKMLIFGRNDQKCIFWAKFGCFWAKNPNFYGSKYKFCYQHNRNHLDNLSALFFGQALDQMGQKCRYLAQNASFGPNLAVFGPKIQFLGTGSKNFGTLVSGFQ